MFDYIQGKLASLTPTTAVLDVQGVGYRLYVSVQTASVLENKKEAKLYTHTVVREDDHRLFGFITPGERSLFLALIGVSSVGPNSALTILSAYNAGQLQQIIQDEDNDSLKAVKGIGMKTAQRIIVDLKDKLEKLAADVAPPTAGPAPANETASRRQEAVSALESLGFSRPAVQKTIHALLNKYPDSTVEELIRKALKNL